MLLHPNFDKAHTLLSRHLTFSHLVMVTIFRFYYRVFTDRLLYHKQIIIVLHKIDTECYYDASLLVVTSSWAIFENSLWVIHPVSRNRLLVIQPEALSTGVKWDYNYEHFSREGTVSDRSSWSKFPTGGFHCHGLTKQAGANLFSREISWKGSEQLMLLLKVTSVERLPVAGVVRRRRPGAAPIDVLTSSY